MSDADSRTNTNLKRLRDLSGHVIGGPMRGLKRLHPMAQTDKQTNRQTDGHGESKTKSAQRGRVGEKENNLPEKWFQKEESWFSTLECQFSFCFH